MLNDQNTQTTQITGAASTPQVCWAITGASNRVRLTRNKKYRVRADYDVYFQQSATGLVAEFAVPQAPIRDGSQEFFVTTEWGEYVFIQAVATNGHVVFEEQV